MQSQIEVDDRGAIAIEVNRVCKHFRIPLGRPDTLKERVVHPFRKTPYRNLEVLRDVSFSVRKGEFFGIVGRNGSGKSTLLKLVASIYRTDRGRIRVAGEIAPIIELGVGFQPEMSARDNVITNGLMLGLTPREARRRFDSVIEFAELEEFVELKLKNYSSGMRARLAFAIAIEADPDVLLLDEVLAVGDAPFQKRCQAAFEDLKRRRMTTIVLVTHAMGNIERHCDQAMLLEAGKISYLGDPEEVCRLYKDLEPTAPSLSTEPPLELDELPDIGQTPLSNGDRADVGPGPEAPTQSWAASRIAAMKIRDADQVATEEVEPGEPLDVHLTLDADQPLLEPRLLLWITDETGATSVFAPPPIFLEGETTGLGNGNRVGVRARIENRLAPGRYLLYAQLASGPRAPHAEFSPPESIGFTVSASGVADRGFVRLGIDVQTTIEGKRR